ncbi:endo alpha-1,4 polygalactosaminidase [Frondihabitans peucedani]|uniref:Endo alpha-1,4 polygalactosaminidase n=1 Tax=Frondihabitans peucedani TaxID=598626 RepID=A0ABP8E4Q0_9MICO
MRTTAAPFLAAVAAVLSIGLVGCAGAGSGTPSAARADSAAVTLPPTTGGFDYQLGGGYTPPRGTTVVTRDSTDTPAKSVYSICYVNGFQTQPGASWPSDLILHTASGAPLVDPGWPDEHIIDVSTAAKRTRAAARIGTTIASCAKKGFRAVEFDNLDSYSRSKKALTLAENVAFAKLLVGRAHTAGLAASQKNTAELAKRGHDEIGFDFVTAEECDTYSECAVFTKAYGKRVYDIEYTDDLRGTFHAVCARTATPKLTILRDRDLVTPRSKAYVYQRC